MCYCHNAAEPGKWVLINPIFTGKTLCKGKICSTAAISYVSAVLKGKGDGSLVAKGMICKFRSFSSLVHIDLIPNRECVMCRDMSHLSQRSASVFRWSSGTHMAFTCHPAQEKLHQRQNETVESGDRTHRRACSFLPLL